MHNNVNVTSEEEKEEEKEEARDTQPAPTVDAELLKKLDAPRQHAMRCSRTVPSTVPIYYFDTFGDFHQLGKERVRRAFPADESRDEKRARCL